MLDVGWSELLLVAIVALVVIGPKDLPKAMRVVGHWVGRMRAVSRQFRAGFDNMVREAELEEMEKRWAAENARIMAAHGAGAQTGSAIADPVYDAAAAGEGAHAPSFDGVVSQAPDDASDTHDPFAVQPEGDATAEPVHVERPRIRPAPGDPHAPPHAGVTS